MDVGLNFAYLPGLEGKMTFQPNFGLGIHLKIKDQWYFAPEFKPLSIKGQRDRERVFAFPVEVEGAIITSGNSLRLNYLEVPLLFQYRFTYHI